MPQSITSYIRTQGVIAAVINAVVNPVLAWLGNRAMEPVTLDADHSIIVDTALTALILSLLVALFVTTGLRRDLKAGRVAPADGPCGEGRMPCGEARLLARLPRNMWALGLALGLGIAVILVLLIYGAFHLAGIREIPFVAFAVFKAVYTPLLGFAVTRWVVLVGVPKTAL